jgi:hypothetical protein
MANQWRNGSSIEINKIIEIMKAIMANINENNGSGEIMNIINEMKWLKYVNNNENNQQ